MVWVYILAAVVLYLLLKELIRLPTVGKYGERYVFITGCDTGFGNLLAKRLDSLGFNVFAACYTEKGEDELRKVSSERLKTLSLDVTKIESILKARETLVRLLPTNKGLWAVVNNAGINGPVGVSEWFTRADYEACLAVNLYGVIDVTRIFQPLLRKGQGRVVNMCSVVGRITVANAAYSVSKYGVEAFSDCLRREVFRQGISVHIVEPGHFKTDLIRVDAIDTLMQKYYSQASSDVQLYYGREFLDKACVMFKDRMKALTSPEKHLVIDAYTHAITAMFPQYRYLVGNDAKYYFRILWHLPEWITDRILTGTGNIPEGAKTSPKE